MAFAVQRWACVGLPRMTALLTVGLMLLLLQSGGPTFTVAGAPSLSTRTLSSSSSAAAYATTIEDPITREFYGRIRELLEQNARLTNADDEEDEALAQLPAIGSSGGSEADQGTGAAAPVDTGHLDSPPKPRALANWPPVALVVGPIAAVAVNADGNPVIFHRGERVWADYSFNDSHHFQQPEEPIRAATILTLDAHSGRTLAAHGAEQFYMPHGLTIDRHGHIWLTDVALHQVFKYQRPEDVDEQRPSLVIGQRFRPGVQHDQLCKPTAVAVATTGEFFIADGYCNARILKFNAAGRLLRVIPQLPDEFLSLNVPHGLALLEPLDLLCIADRENSQVVCPRAGLRSSRGEGQPAATVQEPDLGRVYAVATYGSYVYAVNGPTAPHIPVRGFTIDPRSEQIIDHWGAFENPHGLAFAANGSAMYVAQTGPNRLWKFELV